MKSIPAPVGEDWYPYLHPSGRVSVGTQIMDIHGRCGSATGRCSRHMRKMVGSLLRDVLRGGLAWGRSPDRWRVVSHQDGSSGGFHGSSSRQTFLEKFHKSTKTLY
jgi:hypothetical protein